MEEVDAMTGRRTAVGVFVIAVIGCDVDELPAPVGELDEVSARALEVNGINLNSFRLNSFRLNGFRLNNFRLDGDAGSGSHIDLESLELAQGGTVANAWLAGSELRVTTTNGTTVVGTQLAGAVLHFGVVEGASKKRKVKIAGVTPPAPGSEVWLYDLQIKDHAGPWEPLCVTSLGQATQAILIGEAWNPTTGGRVAATSDLVTLACRDGAVGKCAMWGYYPWSLPEYHQACTRLIRADYCGDGRSHTLEGTSIHVLDEIGVEDVEPGVTYAVEAEWTAAGASCLDLAHTRLSAPDLACELPACGTPFASGGLIQTGVPEP